MKKLLLRYFSLLILVLVAGTTVVMAQAWDFVFAEGDVVPAAVIGENGSAVVADNDFNFYVVGSFGGNTTFSGTGGSSILRSSQGNLDIFVAKYDYTGTILWVSTIGGPFDETGVDVAYDESNDQIVVIGNVQGDVFGEIQVIDFLGGNTIFVVDETGNDIAIVVFRASDGSFFDAWEVIGGSNNDQAGGVVVDPYNGDIYVTGSFIGPPRPCSPLLPPLLPNSIASPVDGRYLAIKTSFPPAVLARMPLKSTSSPIVPIITGCWSWVSVMSQALSTANPPPLETHCQSWPIDLPMNASVMFASFPTAIPSKSEESPIYPVIKTSPYF